MSGDMFVEIKPEQLKVGATYKQIYTGLFTSSRIITAIHEDDVTYVYFGQDVAGISTNSKENFCKGTYLFLDTVTTL